MTVLWSTYAARERPTSLALGQHVLLCKLDPLVTNTHAVVDGQRIVNPLRRSRRTCLHHAVATIPWATVAKIPIATTAARLSSILVC
jgi:hypothetical protein